MSDEYVIPGVGQEELPVGNEQAADSAPDGETAEDQAPEPEGSGEVAENTDEKKEDEPKEQAPSPDELKAEVERLRKQVAEKEKLVNKHSNEVGKWRKALDVLNASMPSESPEERQRLALLAANDPDAWWDEKQKIEANRAERKRLEALIASEERIAANREAVSRVVPDLETAIPEIARMLEEDGVQPEHIKSFTDNPYQLDPALIHNLRQRAVLVGQLAKLGDEVEQLRKENAALKGRPDEMLAKIENAAKSRPMTGNAGDAAGKEGAVEYDPSNPFALPLSVTRKLAGVAGR